ncbi:DNA-directed RNA polymerase subunit beta' [Candidatus Parcubacteria bacterium]|nr:DNA-directed RNA polymerase subunit beta' [Candidatus Parcubacteria bacterium]
MNDALLEQQTSEFDAVRLSLASPEQILDWSHGEVTKPETINYRTQKPEKDGLFCERIFGPTKDWECYCGKYKRLRYKDVVCDKCGVRVTRSIVRRERMGHISLAVPVTHIWFLRGTPSSIGLVLNMSIRDLERVVYFANYVIMSISEDERARILKDLAAEFDARRAERLSSDDPATAAVAELESEFAASKAEIEGLALFQLLSESKYRDLSSRFPDLFTAGMGAEAIRRLLEAIDMETLVSDLAQEAEESQGQKRKKIFKRLKMLEGMKAAGIRPHWMVVTELPVIPPDLRPMVQLAGGRFAASDLNDLYRRVINRNNRLKRLVELGAPEVICRNEKRMLQEAVDALIDNNARRERAVSSTGVRRKLKSLSDMLKGKQGRFRQNLLGKRVDYSGRSVIVAGPNLNLHQCGLPKMMALELFKPFIIGQLIEQDLTHNVKSASRMIERGRNEVWDALEDIIADKYVLLNRAPTLHRLGIQAFQPILIEGKAIQLHPLVCAAFNADFDGDQMAVHVPLSEAAQREAREIMLAANNLLKPADGSAVVNPSKDMVLGCYYLTFDKFGAQQAVKTFSSINEALYSHELRMTALQAKVKLPVEGRLIETTIGRLLFNEALPEGLGFRNETMTKKTLQRLVAEIFAKCGSEVTARAVNDIKNLGFRYATESGISVGIDDFVIPEDKQALIDAGEERSIGISKQYEQGFVTEEERYNRTVDNWKQVNEKITDSLERVLKHQSTSTNVFIDSGAAGDLSQANQIAGMLGLVADPAGRTIELPIRSNYKEGFSVLEYFNSTHGARKGLTDTALKTAESGYLTRRLVDVAQDVIITVDDCGDSEGSVVTRGESEAIGESFAYRLAGRVAVEDVKDQDKKVLVKAGEMITDNIAAAIDRSDIAAVRLRSVLRCRTYWGICQACYGLDLARGRLVAMGEPVGVIAAQSIGEPGTQLTMKTFHKGGVAGEDITTGLPRVEEIFEARNPKGQAVISEISGVVSVHAAPGKRIIRISPAELKVTEYELGGRTASVKSGAKVVAGDVIAAEAGGKKPLKAKAEGTVKLSGDKLLLTHSGGNDKEYAVPSYQNLEVSDGDLVGVGQRLTEGSISLQEILQLLGEVAVQRYIVAEVQSIYASQGQPISDKHIEVVIRQMLSRVQIEEPGDTLFVTGDIVSKLAVVEENAELEAAGKRTATYEQLLLGVSKISLSSDSFLSAASFQDTTRVLIQAATRGKVDRLRGLKENVIIGRLIPVGTGFRHTTDEYNADARAAEAAAVQSDSTAGGDAAEELTQGAKAA